MARRNGIRRLTGALADATGRSDEELRLVLTLAAIVAGLFAAIRLLKLLADLGADVFGRSRR
jgi:alkylhydroperoxidase/carboxymuconolactone decarboxylase family protein YurZ